MSAKLIKQAADTIEAQATKIAELESALTTKTEENTKLAAELSSSKDAGSKRDQAAQEAAAKIAPLAKTAADKLFDRGLLSSPERRDQFAANVLSHEKALDALTKVADYIDSAPKVGTVVINETKPETADDVWDRHTVSALNRLPGAR
jgi:hypothetical protein